MGEIEPQAQKDIDVIFTRIIEITEISRSLRKMALNLTSPEELEKNAEKAIEHKAISERIKSKLTDIQGILLEAKKALEKFV